MRGPQAQTAGGVEACGHRACAMRPLVVRAAARSRAALQWAATGRACGDATQTRWCVRAGVPCATGDRVTQITQCLQCSALLLLVSFGDSLWRVVPLGVVPLCHVTMIVLYNVCIYLVLLGATCADPRTVFPRPAHTPRSALPCHDRGPPPRALPPPLLKFFSGSVRDPGRSRAI